MHLVDIIPKVFEVFDYTLFVHLCKVIDSRVDQTQTHQYIQEIKQDCSTNFTLTLFISAQLHEERYVNVENQNIDHVDK